MVRGDYGNVLEIKGRRNAVYGIITMLNPMQWGLCPMHYTQPYKGWDGCYMDGRGLLNGIPMGCMPRDDCPSGSNTSQDNHVIKKPITRGRNIPYLGTCPLRPRPKMGCNTPYLGHCPLGQDPNGVDAVAIFGYFVLLAKT